VNATTLSRYVKRNARGVSHGLSDRVPYWCRLPNMTRPQRRFPDEPPTPKPVDVLPNNLADWPARKSWLNSDSGSGGGTLGRVLAKAVLLLFVGGIVGFGGYRWAISFDETSSLAPPSVTTPALDDSPSSTPDDAASTSADTSAPELDLTGLIGNHAESQNWSGYAATEGGYTGVSATWSVSDVASGSPAGVDAAWVGIGGVKSRDLIQAGTQRVVMANGATRQEAWVELLPRASETVPLTVHRGDVIRVSIDQQATDTWLIAFTNTTSGQTYQVTKRYASSLSSAEWIEEAPSSGRGRPLPLSNFGTIRFSQASAVRGTQTQTIAESGAHAVTMTAPGGLALAEPTRLGADGASFSVTRTSTQSPRRRP